MYVQRMRRNYGLLVELVSLVPSQKMQTSVGLTSKYAQLNMYVDTNSIVFLLHRK